ncbi:MAG: 23S rRNA pseudouridylate synthase B [Gammaproteobacteria bacterium]|nr:MAG: 23S rRNA pseudouridylate synthase B [Gammaproteobacteria bacterium]
MQRSLNLKINMSNSIRIQKAISQSQIASRRATEKMIKNQQIRVNGNVAKLGDKVIKDDKINIDNNSYVCIEKKIDTKILIYHKPIGVICTKSDPERRETVFDQIPQAKANWLNIGRLDINSSGLLLFTNNGELCYRLTHPSYEITRKYIVRILGELDKEQIKKCKDGILYQREVLKLSSIKLIAGEGINKTYAISLKEGKNHEIRNIFESFGFQVNKLLRVEFANIALPRELKPGKSFLINNYDTTQILNQVNLPLQSTTLQLKFTKKTKRKMRL